MLKYGSWDLPGVDYFLSKNSFKGSKNDFRFIVSGGDVLKVCYWTEDICFELAKNPTEKEFSLTEQSLYDINEYLTAQYKAFKKDED